MKKHLMWFLVGLAAVFAVSSTNFTTAAEKIPGQTDANAGQQVTLKDLQKQAAANRKSKGKMKSTTNDDRWTAAKRNADRHAQAVAKKKGVRK